MKVGLLGRRRSLEVAEAGFQDWIDRVLALTGLGTGVVSVLLATGQAAHLNRVWLVTIAGALLVASALLPVYAWTRRGLALPASLYGGTVGVGLWTWPLAWNGPVGQGDHSPWLWPAIGVSTVVVAMSWGLFGALRHNLIASVAYLIARLSPIGGAVEPVTAVQDTLAVAIQPILVLLLFAYVRRQAATLDAWVAAARAGEADAALRATLVDERARWDAIIHDEVMTALVAGARSVGPHDPNVAQLAQRAVVTLHAQGGEPVQGQTFHPTNVARFLHDVAVSVNPGIQMHDDVDPLAALIPQPVVEAVARAAREAVLNAEKHAEADNVTMVVTVRGQEDEVRLQVTIVDDGIGFDPESVPGRRLGIRLSLMRRIRSVGGVALVDSAPGRGTRVTITWEGRGAAADARTPSRGILQHPLVSRLNLGPIAVLAGMGATLFTTVALLQALSSPRPQRVVASVRLLCVAIPLCMVNVGGRMSPWTTALVVVLGLVVTGLNLAALPEGEWPLHGTAFIGAICVLVVLVRAVARRRAAWALAQGAGVMVLVAAALTGQQVLMEVGVALNPVGWLVAFEMLIVWVGRVQGQLDLAQRAADEASAASSAAFSRLVVREVWLAEVRDQVGDLLTQLADPDVVITTPLREACLAAEGGLRDAIKSANFSAPSLSAAILRARLRGVEVTLVDNRGGRLDEHVRRIATRHLERLVEEADSGRIVARTAPAGYGEPVTIVQTGTGGSELTRINDDGRIVVKQA